MPDPAYDQAVKSARREKAMRKLFAYYGIKAGDPMTDDGIKKYQRAVKKWIAGTPKDIKKQFGIKGGLVEPGVGEPEEAWRKRVGEENAREWDEAESLVLDDLDNVDYATLPKEIRYVWEGIDNEGKVGPPLRSL